MSENAVQVNSTKPEFEDPTDLGIRLEVTPTVNPNNYSILLELNPVRTDFAGWTDYKYNIISTTIVDNAGVTDTVVANYEQPVKMANIHEREVRTKVLVYDGSTTVLGGMVRDDTKSFDDIIPVLGEIPIVGRLFRSEYTRSEKTNLLIFVTARLVKPDGTPFRKPAEDGLFQFGQY
jgi:type II secretory pathway component GspD/PulD (secretin)